MEKLKVIVADDIEILLKGIVKIVKESKKVDKIEVAQNGKELLEKIKEFEPDIVFTDLKMPELTGIEVIEEVKKLKTSKKPIFILITSERGFDVIQKSKELNFYIEYKPVMPEKIHEYINNLEEYKTEHSIVKEENKIEKQSIWKRIINMI